VEVSGCGGEEVRRGGRPEREEKDRGRLGIREWTGVEVKR